MKTADLDARHVDARSVPMGRPFTIVGHGCPHQLDHNRPDPLVVDAYGLRLPNGHAATYSLNANDTRTQTWDSPQQAAEAFAGYLVWGSDAGRAGAAGSGGPARSGGNDREASQ